MAINLRGTAVVADGSITEAKLANDSVSAAKIQTNAVIDTKIAANAVTEAKIATDAVTTTKIAADAVSIDKVTDNIGIQHFLGHEVEFAHIGTVLTSIAEFNFTKKSVSNVENWKSIGWAVSLKSSNVLNTATVQLWIDGVAYAQETSSSTTYEHFSSDNSDISALADGLHLVEIKLVNDTVGETATINKLDVYLGKKPV